MNTQISPFAFEDHLIRVFTIDGESWWVARDVCRALDISSHESVYERIPEDEKGIGKTDTLGGEQEVVIVSEPGLYRLIFRSNKPVAERFRRWVFHEVLPSIRKTGKYEASVEHEKEPRVIMPGHPDFGHAIRMVREARLSRGAEAALAVWKSSGLLWVPELESDAVLKAEAGTDSVALFAREGIEPAPGVLTPAALIAPAYVQFCAARQLPAYGQASFQTRFGRMGFKKVKTTGRSVYLDIRIKPGNREAAL